MALTKVNRGGLNTGIADSSNATAITISSSEIVTLADDLIIKDSGTIGSASKTDAITIAASGNTQLRSTGIAAGSQVFQIIDDGTTVLNVRSEDGNINFPVAGGGIFLGVTAAASSNLLNDYEEGAWTATLTGSTSDPSTAVTQAGIYTKIGNMVYAQFQMSNVNSTGAAGGVRITGLPFTAGGAQATGSVMFYVRFTIGTTSANVSPYVQGSRIDFYQSVNQAGWGEVAHNAGTGAYISVSVFYKTNS